MKKNYKIIFVLIILILLFSNILFSSGSKINFKDKNYIAHAGGGYKNVIYTNSEESVLKSIEMVLS